MSIERLTTLVKKASGAAIAALLIVGAIAPSASAREQAPKPPAWLVQAVEGGKRCKMFERKMADHGLPVTWFTYIAYRESRCRVGAVNAKWKNGKIVWTLNANGTFDSGLFQINSGWRTLTKQTCGGGLDLLLKADCNFKMAKVLYEDGGLRHWGFNV
jgi:hypothetical protein